MDAEHSSIHDSDKVRAIFAEAILSYALTVDNRNTNSRTNELEYQQLRALEPILHQWKRQHHSVVEEVA